MNPDHDANVEVKGHERRVYANVSARVTRSDARMWQTGDLRPDAPIFATRDIAYRHASCILTYPQV